MYRLIGVLMFVALPGGWLQVAAGAQEHDIRQRLASALPELEIRTVSRSPLENFYLVTLEDGQMIYASADGKYLFAGTLYQVLQSGVADLTERARSDHRRRIMQGMSEEEMVVFPAKGQTQSVLTIFTDIDCGYCRKLHQEVPALNQLGIKVRYLAYPRAGIPSGSYDKIVSAWCAENPQVALTKAKLGKEIPDLTCSNPVASHLELGRKFGVSGTPAMVLESGQLVPGYVSADRLAEMLGVNR